MSNPRRMRVTAVYRYARGPGLDEPTIDGFPNYHFLSSSIDGTRTLLESGINPVREAKAVDGLRRPVIAIRSSPWKAGTETTPWHDVFALDRGHIRYFGDHKPTSSGPVGSTAGNAALAEAWNLHQGKSRTDRVLAPPLMVFRAVRANGAVKGYVQFCGVALIERMAQVVQRDPLTGSSFPNYVFDLLVIDTSKEGDEVDWRWIDDRRDPSLSLEQTLRFAPSAWCEWVSAGTGTPGHTGLLGNGGDSEALSEPNSNVGQGEAFDDGLLQLIRRVIRVGQVITTLSKGRPNRIVAIDSGGLLVETEKSVSQETGPRLVPAWMIIAGWRHLTKHGRLSQVELLDDLNVKRSAFVAALLAHIPGVEIEEGPNVVLRLKKSAMRGIAESDNLGRGRSGQGWFVKSEESSPRPGGQAARMDSPVGDHKSWPGAVTYAARLNLLFDTVRGSDGRLHTSADVAEALQADGILVHPDSIERLRAGAGGRPTDTLSYGLSFFFDVDPNHFVVGGDDCDVGADQLSALPGHARAGRDARSGSDAASALELSAAQFVRVFAGLAQAARRCCEDPESDQNLLNQLTLTLSDAGALLLESLSGKVVVPRELAERTVTRWAEANPSDDESRTEYLWAAAILGHPNSR